MRIFVWVIFDIGKKNTEKSSKNLTYNVNYGNI